MCLYLLNPPVNCTNTPGKICSASVFTISVKRSASSDFTGFIKSSWKAKPAEKKKYPASFISFINHRFLEASIAHLVIIFYWMKKIHKKTM